VPDLHARSASKKKGEPMKTIIVQLTEEEVASLRIAASDRLNNLAEVDMNDPALERLIGRITKLAEKAWKVKYGQQL
jgi:hypothetical protein